MKPLTVTQLDRLEGLIWDMDGVLINESRSYLEAIRRTASLELGRKVSPAEVEEIKQVVGMNNDWYATFSLVTGKRDYASIDPYSPLFQKLKNIFNAMYLGNDLYSALTGKPSPVDQPHGLIATETTFFSDDQLETLKQRYGKMAIATGRPRFDAEYVMKRFQWDRFFDVLVSAGDTENEKPAPDPILYAKEQLQISKTVYIGDNISDVLAAQAAGLPVLFVGDNRKLYNSGTTSGKRSISTAGEKTSESRSTQYSHAVPFSSHQELYVFLTTRI